MLKYIGNGSFIVNIPARDLTEAEVLLFGEEYLLSTGLYGKPVTEQKMSVGGVENKVLKPLTENKDVED